ncbi:hypothetical protein EDD86DRAFT_210705 [Gorgonomyces haynaldii]|nr:hypothetical protein EDD86DRAFT_210705 [Gorgonomyces haynaldii]
MTLQNRAIEGDIVLVQLLDGQELAEEQDRVMKKRLERQQGSRLRQEKISLQELDDDEELQEHRIYGKVVGIAESNAFERTFVGTLHMERPGTDTVDERARFVWFKPNDKRIPFMMLSKETVESQFLKDPSSFSNVLVTCKMKKWSETSRFPLGQYTGKLGQMGELPVETEALLVQNGIFWDDFDDSVLECLPQTPWQIPASEFEKRLDLRQERIFSIDPQTARDLDDAVSLKEVDGKLELGVHIADVSYFVKSGSQLDKEALNRATSIYLVQKVIPMLPRLLCEQLCSLNPNVDRLAFSVFWTLTKDGEFIGEPRFHRSVIRSCAKLSYDHAQATIEGKSWDHLPPVELGDVSKEQIDQDIIRLFELSKVLRKRRFDNGSLTMSSIKLWFKLDDVGNPIDSGIYQLKEANKLIEEFMLLANMAVAHKLAKSYPDAALLRCHPAPLEKGMRELAEELSPYGIELDISSSKKLQESFESIQDPLQRELLRLLAIKKMKRANYFCTGSVDVSQYYHYALGVPLYTHFTSPIRRYCDLVVHRMLDLCIHNQDNQYGTGQVAEIAKQCNQMKNASRDVQDASQNLYLCAYLSDKGEITCDGFVNKIGSRSFDVVLFDYGIEGTVWLEDVMDQIKGIESQDKGLLVHWNTGIERVQMFSQVRVKVCSLLQTSPPSIKLYAVPSEPKK